MKKIIVAAAIISLAMCVEAQSIKRNVIATAGNSVTVNSITLTSTVGETFTNNLSSANNSITQGFQQGNISVERVRNVEEPTELFSDKSSTNKIESRVAENNFHVDVYPNPATDYVNVRINQTPSSKCFMFMSDATGRLIEVKDITSTETRVEFNQLQAGNYFLTVKSEDGKVNESFEIIKQ